ncbi:hypothetical protein PTB14_12435 [Enterococcus faecalis]|nr:hypothetical protein [Enterococcus faecalis]MDD0851218.1 hypothetical protein [Enterococcus faecalis]
MQLNKVKDLWEKQKHVQTAVEKLFQNGQVKPNIFNDEINQA